MQGDTASLDVAQQAGNGKPSAVACALTREQRGYVIDGLRVTYALRHVDTFEQFDRELSSLIRCDVLVLAPQDGAGRHASPVIERIVREWPETGVVVFFPAVLSEAPSAASLVRAGAHELVYEGIHPTAARIAIASDNARRFVAADAVLVRLRSVVPAAVVPMMEAVLSRPERIASVDELARALGVHRKTLFNRCQRSMFVQPAELIVWCRLAMVARLLDRSGATIESIAVTLGYPSHTALRNTVKRYLGCTATEARERGALALVCSALVLRVQSSRPDRPSVSS